VLQNGGTNCPACRGVSLSVTPSRALQTMADVLVRHAPDKARTANERMQADEVYKAGALRVRVPFSLWWKNCLLMPSPQIPTPRQASPEPSIPQGNLNFIHPCPHCLPGNQYGWTCPEPIVDPLVDPDRASHSDNGAPPGHAYCGNW
jgi:E3 ubiquitin-protein ligase CHFR